MVQVTFSEEAKKTIRQHDLTYGEIVAWHNLTREEQKNFKHPEDSHLGEERMKKLTNAFSFFFSYVGTVHVT